MGPRGLEVMVRSNATESSHEAFRTGDVAKILGISPRRVRSMVHAGHCQPGRHGRYFQFHFRDLVQLRTARSLLASKLPARRVLRALRLLVEQLPEDRPLSAVRVYTEGRSIVVRDRHSVWQPESGQQVFSFGTNEPNEDTLVALPLRQEVPAANRHMESAADWFDYGVMIEAEDPNGARRAYTRALEIDPAWTDAYVNLGRLVHEGGDPEGAAGFYREALRQNPEDAIIHYNLAVACEDLDVSEDARAHYAKTVELNPHFADAHFNLGRLLERLGCPEQALEHLLAYRRLTDNL